MAAQDLTLRMILSSLSGWLALATTCAVWTPLIIMNAARLRVSASPRFLYIYLFGDFVNLLGLSFFGHLDPFAPDPRPTMVFAKLRQRKRRHPRWYRITLAFMSYSLWDDVKLLLFCIAAGLAAGGIYLTLGLYHDPEHFAIEVPHALDLKSFIMGLIAQATVCLARIPELRSGESRSKAGFEPAHAVDDPLFWFLIAENSFNLLSIVPLSTNAQYLLVQSPWIGGGALMILLDCVLISRIRVWQKRWKERKGADGKTGAEKEAERVARFAKLDEEKAELEEEWEVEDMHNDAHGPVPKQKAGESRRDYERRVHAHAVARKDYLENQYLVADVKERGERRAHRRDKQNDTSSSAVEHFPPNPDPAASRLRSDDYLPSAGPQLFSTDDEQHASARDFLLCARKHRGAIGLDGAYVEKESSVQLRR
ncbi:hypothetical protein NBRC10513_001688 [Rhodotorula toruloides]